MYRVINKRELVKRLFLYFLALTAVGVLIGAPFLVLFVGTLVLLIWHYRQLYRLSDWLIYQRSFNPPEGRGTWEQVFEGIYRLQHRNRKKRNELADLIRRFREGAEAVPDGVVVLQRDLSIVWCNQIALAILGLKWPQDHGQRLDNLVRNPEFIKYMNKKDFDLPLELSLQKKSERVLEFRVMPYAETQLMVVVRDVTLLKQLEEMRKDFVANVSHELRTPLTVMSGYLEMFEPDAPPHGAMWGKVLVTMQEQCERMASLVNQLLALSRIETPNKHEKDELVDVSKMLQLIKTEADRLNEEKGHQLTFEIADDVNLKGSYDELRSAFSNLVFNAVHYTPNKGIIKVRWSKLASGEARFEVEDNGVGIAPEHINRLTERFYRVDKARSRKTGGSGLGLAITKHVLTRHDSSLEIDSVPEKGSRFYFDFIKERVVVVKNSTVTTE